MVAADGDAGACAALGWSEEPLSVRARFTPVNWPSGATGDDAGGGVASAPSGVADGLGLVLAADGLDFAAFENMAASKPCTRKTCHERIPRPRGLQPPAPPHTQHTSIHTYLAACVCCLDHLSTRPRGEGLHLHTRALRGHANCLRTSVQLTSGTRTAKLHGQGAAHATTTKQQIHVVVDYAPSSWKGRRVARRDHEDSSRGCCAVLRAAISRHV